MTRVVSVVVSLGSLRKGEVHHSKLVKSSKSTCRLDLSTTSIPGPMECASRLLTGKTYDEVSAVEPHARRVEIALSVLPWYCSTPT